ncbi:hypothetical protein B0T10DRAFT_278280 [Thelonectria olida]|uniref:Uncharacterized protein n=1 Tax=Thelonectria olida TaxID=1576542 RepID=A0A9P8VR12_9HYPO|nr:hypothetical protein B0T10DRAFT_278280 [Thelonectria olida]
MISLHHRPEADANDSNFTAHLFVKSDPDTNDGWVQHTFPSTAGMASGKAVASKAHFDGHLKTHQGKVGLSVTPIFKTLVHIKDLKDTSSWKRDDGDLEARRIIGDSMYKFQVYSPMSLSWDESNVALQVDALHYSLLSTGHSSLKSWGSDETSGKAMGSSPGRFVLHKQLDDEDSSAPKYNKKTATDSKLFDDQALTCTEEEDDDDENKRIRKCDADLCKSGDLVCTDPSSNHRPSASSEKRHVHLPANGGHQRRQHSRKNHGFHALKHKYIGRKIQTSPPTLLFEREPTGESNKKVYETNCKKKETGNSNLFKYIGLAYPSVGSWTIDETRYDEAWNAVAPDSCVSRSVNNKHVIPPRDEVVSGVTPAYCTEHIVERQTMQLFLEDVTNNVLADGSASGLDQIYCDFVNLLNDPILEDPPDIAELDPYDVKIPMRRIMWAHGTGQNYERFVFVEANINSMKENGR